MSIIQLCITVKLGLLVNYLVVKTRINKRYSTKVIKNESDTIPIF